MKQGNGEFKLKVGNTGHMMTDLGIKPDRCEELCGLIDEIREEDPELSAPQILAKASEHAQSQNEVIFLSYLVGTDIGASEKIDRQNAVKNFFEQVFGHVTEVRKMSRRQRQEERQASFN